MIHARGTRILLRNGIAPTRPAIDLRVVVGDEPWPGFLSVSADPGALPHFVCVPDRDPLPFADAAVDLLVWAGTLHRTRALGRALAESWRVCRADGFVAVLDFPGSAAARIPAPDGSRRRRAADLFERLRNCGGPRFEVLDVESRMEGEEEVFAFLLRPQKCLPDFRNGAGTARSSGSP